jgi:hypothetical protein
MWRGLSWEEFDTPDVAISCASYFIVFWTKRATRCLFRHVERLLALRLFGRPNSDLTILIS